MEAMTQPDASLMPSSDSDSLPDFPPALSPPNRKKHRPRPNGAAKAAKPIELTSDDEPKPPPPKRKRKSGCKPSSTNVIDLCSDDHELTPRPPRKMRKSRTRPPQEDEIIVLLSSDNDEPPASCSKPSSSKTMNGDRNSFSPAPSMPPIEILRPEENDFAPDTGNASGEQPELPTPQMGSSPASPMADVHEAQSPTDRQAKGVLPDEDGMTSGPLQHIYNEAFQKKSQCEEADPPSPVFSWKIRSKPIQVCEPRPLPSSNPPLLTPGFFKRVREALAVPQNPTTSVQNDRVKGSSLDLQRSTAAVKCDPVPFTPSSVTPEVGERECPKLLSPELSPRRSQAECVIAVEEITEDNNPPEFSPHEVVEAGALHTASPSSPVKEPSPSKTPQSEFTEQANIFNVHETTNATSEISPSAPSPKSMTTSKTVPTDSQQTNAFGPSEAEIQEIEAMLLPETSNDITDEELLAVGLCYPEY